MKFTKKPHSYAEVAQTPNHIFREFTKKNRKGETLIIEFTSFKDDHSKSLLFKDWYKRGLTKCVLQSPWYVQTYVNDEKGNCYERYNITLKDNGARLVYDFKWMLEGTSENLEMLTNEIASKFYGDKNTAK